MSRHHHSLNPRQWALVRRLVFDRDGWRCSCGRAGRLECHHKKALADGGAAYELSNLETKCRRCHFAATADALAEQQPAEVREWRSFMKERIGA